MVKFGHLSEIFVSFQGEGADVGRRHLFIRMAGCNLHCRYCDTPDSLQRTDAYTAFRGNHPPEVRPNPVSAEQLAGLITSMLEQEAPIDAIALTGGEPLAQSEFLVALLEVGRFPLPVLLETNGMLPQQLQKLLPLVNIVSMDIKLPSNTGEAPLWEDHAQCVQLAKTTDLYVKILVDQNTLDEDVERAVVLLASIEPRIPVFLQPITDTGANPSIDLQRLTRFYRIARQRLASVRVLPQTHKLIGIR
jgi:organic radical activating enzyme